MEKNTREGADRDLLKEYYRKSEIRARMIEYLGGSSLKEATCVYLSRSDTEDYHNFAVRIPNDLPYYLDQGLDVARSIWDRRSLLIHLDIEYVNFDYPAEPYLNPERTFAIQEPVVRTLEEVLTEYGIAALHFLTGRGHHFVWRVRADTEPFRLMSKLGRMSPALRGMYRTPHPPHGEPVPEEMGKAFAGLALVAEFLAGRVKELSAPRCDVPVELTAVAVGCARRGREIVSLDVSEYGDPLHTRMIRLPFSAYRKPWEHGFGTAAQLRDRIPPVMVMVPLHEMGMREGISVMRDFDRAAELARRVTVRIPELSQGTGNLVRAYEASPLRRFHDFFYSEDHDPPEKWPATYDRAPLERLPRCARHVVEHPNDLLARPAGIELVVRSLLALGWHPRHVAGLIRSKYERDYGWGNAWIHYDAGTRADFYTRIFAGLFAVGRDELIDFNCLSTKEKGFCFHPHESCDLDAFRNSLMERRNHDRLAHRPFNRLFLPHKHPGSSGEDPE